jgi:hypothetical protein
LDCITVADRVDGRLSRQAAVFRRSDLKHGEEDVCRRERRMSHDVTAAAAPARPSTRWVQLTLGIVCMASVANLQYGWTLLVLPIQNQWGWTKAEIQVAFTIFILLETWLVPFEGAIVDRIGPRWMVFAGGVRAPGRTLPQQSLPNFNATDRTP